jgi:RNA-binding protein
MPTTLSGKQRRALRALAHALKPVVLVGQRGVTAALLRQVDTALTDHELIKVKLGPDCPIDRKEAGEVVASGVDCELAGIVGRVLVLYRRHPENPRIESKLPRSTAVAADAE